MKILAALIFITFSPLLFGQTIEIDRFSDSTGGFLKKIDMDVKVDDGVIISGKKMFGSVSKAVFLKLNVLGEVVWSTSNQVLPLLTSTDFTSFELFEDGYIYCSTWNISDQHFIWKINAETGHVEWMLPFYGNDRPMGSFCELDENRFIGTYNISQYHSRIAIFDKSNGDTLLTKQFSTTSGNYHNTAVDEFGNIYLGYLSVLTKYNGDDLNSIIWQKTYLDGPNDLDEIHKMHLDDNGDLYLFGRNGGASTYGSGVTVKVNPYTGNSVWNIISASGSVRIADFIDKNDYLYSTYQHALVGGGTYFWRTSKVSKIDGAVSWNVFHFVTPDAGSTSTDNEQSALSMDIDCNGDIYQTGYYDAANYGPGNWGVMKLNGATGAKLYDFTVTEDSTLVDERSSGQVMAIFDDSPVMLGQVQIGETIDTKTLFLTFQPQTGEIIIRKRIGGEYQFGSGVPDMLSVDSSNFILKQVGSKLHIDKYINGTLNWSSVIPGNAILKGRHLALNDTILYVSAYVQLPSTVSPYYQNGIDKIALYKINSSNGNLIGSTFITDLSADALPLQLEADTTGCFIIYNNNDSIRFRSWTNNILSDQNTLWESSENINYPGNFKIAIRDSNSLYVSGTNKIVKVDKATLSQSTYLEYSEALEVHNVSVRDSLLMICGVTSGQGTLISVNMNTAIENWKLNFSDFQNFYNICADSTYVYVTATENNQISILKLSAMDGTEIWESPISSENNAIPLDFEFAENQQSFILTGKTYFNTNESNGLVVQLKDDGIILNQFDYFDEINSESNGFTAASVNDSTIWFGGSLNEITYSKSGYIHSISYHYVIESFETDLNVFVLPSDANNCTGIVAFTVNGTPDFTFQIGSEIVSSSTGEAIIDSLCPGIYSVFITNGDGDTLTAPFVIPSDSSYIFNNFYQDSIPLDSLGLVIPDCEINFSSIDTAYILDIHMELDTAFVTWEVIDSTGSHTFLTSYILDSTGTYDLQLSIYCLQKSIGNYFTVTQRIYFDGENAHFLEIFNSETTNFILYPNPTDGNTSLLFSGNNGSVIIRDILGKVVYKKSIYSGESIFLNELASGMYVLDLFIEYGRFSTCLVKK